MEGVTTAIVLAIFAGVYWPHAIRNRQQFQFAIGAVLLIILFHVLGAMIGHVGFLRFVAVMVGLCQIVAILGIILAASGQSVGEFAADTIEVVRRGEEEKEILIKGAGTRRARGHGDDVGETTARIDLGPADAAAGRAPVRPIVPPVPPPPAGSGGPIPLDE
jgi:hypothetical protein